MTRSRTVSEQLIRGKKQDNDPSGRKQMFCAQDISFEVVKVIANAVYADAPSPISGAWRLSKILLASPSFLNKAKYTCHVFIEGHSFSEVKQKIALARKAPARLGHESPNTISMVISSNPSTLATHTSAEQASRQC